MTTTTELEQRRNAEIARYDHTYFGIMRLWRQDILREWLSHNAKRKAAYLDVGCGKAESLSIGYSLGLQARGCDVQAHLCHREDIDLIAGAHKLPYQDDEFSLASCNDVMEHIVPEDVPAVLSEMRRVCRGSILLGISQKPGEWHICIRETEWWMEQALHSMGGTVKVVYADRIPRIKQPYVWLEVR